MQRAKMFDAVRQNRMICLCVYEDIFMKHMRSPLLIAANAFIVANHPKAMPVILTNADDIETWLTAPAEEALKLQRPSDYGVLKIVAVGERKDGSPVSSSTL
jgi:putative SOS response-associated peptidase YedK